MSVISTQRQLKQNVLMASETEFAVVGTAIGSPVRDRIDFVPTTGTIVEEDVHSCYVFRAKSCLSSS